jgi:hypothetical protein
MSPHSKVTPVVVEGGDRKPVYRLLWQTRHGSNQPVGNGSEPHRPFGRNPVGRAEGRVPIGDDRRPLGLRVTIGASNR